MAEDSGQIREAIEGTRSEIAETVQALGGKADVKGRISETVNEKTAELKTRAAGLQDSARNALPDSAQPKADAALDSARRAANAVTSDPTKKRAVAIAAGAMLILMILRRRRRRHRS